MSIQCHIKSILIFLLFASSTLFRADNLPNYVQLLDNPGENYFLELVIYHDYSQNIYQRTDLERNEYSQVKEAIIKNTAGEKTTKLAYSYDANGYQTSMLTYSYKNGDWQPQKLDEYSFDDQGRQIMSAKYEYINNEKKGIGEKWTKSFHTNGECQTYEAFTWKNNAWVSFMQQTTSFNEMGNALETTTDNDGSLSKVSFMYDASTDLLDCELYQTNGVYSFGVFYLYDSSRRITSTEMNFFEGGAWKPFEERVFSYSDSDKKTTVTRHVFSVEGKKTAETSFTSNADHAIVTTPDGSIWKHSNVNGYTLSKQVGSNWENVARYDYTGNDDFANTLGIYSENDKKVYQLRWDASETPNQLSFFQEYIGNSGAAEVEKKIIFSFTKNVSTPEEITKTKSFNIYPNPVVDFLRIEFSDILTDDADYFIYNTLGKLVTRGKIYNPAHEINLNSLPSGQYVFNVQLNGKSYSMILLKQ